MYTALLVLCLTDTYRCATIGHPLSIEVARAVGGRIVGGVKATQEQGKYQCSVHVRGWFGEAHNCGCSLYGTKFVITAAHCTNGYKNTDLVIKYGGLNVDTLPIKSEVAEIRQHESYDKPIRIDYDYAVIVLADNIQTTPGKVETIQLVDTEPADGAEAHATGWGRLVGTDKNSGAKELQYQKFQIVSYDSCVKAYAPYPNIDISRQMICAKHQTSSTCNGDSGGPLIVGGKLAGIVSWVITDCPSNTVSYPSGYANVFIGRDWLLSKLK
ncbi:unnamed protein product [Medioppia subpectinata]|uniref:Peptidase S1 domain-containing protein n=1 Tax=Medioppia subpectinata TaxID=1979941 RepID=A0A7R9L0C6_9ACAR|nr:unnamed protein product [Medioppia subpectinata]CAG2112075.1 unnamed protein product [Medioppia subpectinata]